MVARAVERELSQVFKPRFRVLVIVRQVRLIAARQDQLDLARGIPTTLVLDETFEQREKLGPAGPAPRRRREIRAAHERQGVRGKSELFPDSIGGGLPDVRD